MRHILYVYIGLILMLMVGVASATTNVNMVTLGIHDEVFVETTTGDYTVELDDVDPNQCIFEVKNEVTNDIFKMEIDVRQEEIEQGLSIIVWSEDSTHCSIEIEDLVAVDHQRVNLVQIENGHSAFVETTTGDFTFQIEDYHAGECELEVQNMGTGDTFEEDFQLGTEHTEVGVTTRLIGYSGDTCVFEVDNLVSFSDIPQTGQEMRVYTDKREYQAGEIVKVFTELPRLMNCNGYFVQGNTRNHNSYGGCLQNGMSFSATRNQLGEWRAEIEAWYPEDPNTKFTVQSEPFTVVEQSDDGILRTTLSSETPFGKTYKPGSRDVTLIAIDVEAPEHTDVTLSGVTFVGSTASREGSWLEGVEHFELWDGARKLSYQEGFEYAHQSLSFYDFEWQIPRGTTRTLTLKADIAKDAAPASFIAILSGYSYQPIVNTNWHTVGPIYGSVFKIGAESLSGPLLKLVRDEPVEVKYDNRLFDIELLGVSNNAAKCSLEINDVVVVKSVGQKSKINGLEFEVKSANPSNHGRDSCVLRLDRSAHINYDDLETDLSNFPELFIDDGVFDATYIVGAQAPSSDVVAAIEIRTGIAEGIGESLPVPSAKLDTEIASFDRMNLISIGNACNNAITSEIEGNPANCLEGLTPGEGVIKLYKGNGARHVVVSGYHNVDVRKAARVLANWKKFDLFGSDVRVTGSLDDLKVRVVGSRPGAIISPGEDIAEPDDDIEEPEVVDSCFDGIRNQGEQGVDCGGPCAPCAQERVPTCTDGIKNGFEEDVDCGGPCRSCEATAESCNGCLKDGACLPFGTRVTNGADLYCSIGKEFKEQLPKGSACQNNYECGSNQCNDGACGSLAEELRETRGFMERFARWVKALFPWSREAPDLRIALPETTTPARAVCKTPLASLHSSTSDGIAQNARATCLGALTTLDGPPILGDSRGQPILFPNNKYGNDILGEVIDGVLECSVPCSNAHAAEIQTCFDFEQGRIPFPIEAETC